ncbi:velvet factor-domain-containing protein [Butyriboletus roseoflavus]|nr:velvet factor-domain-containing protein [Butyriboletus roseoflavus]
MSNYHREYELTVRQEPKQARMCGVGADRRPIDPPPIIQLRVIDPHTRQPPSPANPDPEDADPNYAHSFLQNPYYFMFASLAKPDDDTELHWLKDGKTRCTTGSVVSSLYHLKDTENSNEDAGFFVFPDLSVRTEGSYRLKLSLFEVVGNTVRHCKSIYSAAFYVYTAKKFPGMEESTPLSCSLADQGIKIRIRKDIRVRKRPIAALAPPSDGGPPNTGETRKVEQDQAEDDAHAQQPHPPLSSQPASSNAASSAAVKRARHGTFTGPPHLVSGPSSSSDGMSAHTPVSGNNNKGSSSIALAGLPAWPTSSTLDPMLGVASATPGGIELSATSALPHAHAHTHTHAHQTMGGSVGVGVSGQLLSAGSEPSSSGSGSAAGAETRRTGPQALSSSSASSYPSSSSSVGGMYDRLNYDYEPASLRGTSSSYDPQRPLGGGSGTTYESASSGSGSGRGEYDAGGTRSGYEGGAGGGRTTFEHAQQHHTRGSYDPRGGYESSQAHPRAPYNAHPHTQTQTEVHGHTPRASFNAPYEGAQAYQDGQQQQQQQQQQHHHHGGYAHPQQTSASYAHVSSTGSHPHPHPSTSHHPQQGQYPSPTRSQYPGSAYPGSYARYNIGASTNPNVNPNANANGPGTGGSGGYYDTPSSSSSPHPQPHTYYPGGTSGQAQAQPSQVAPPPPPPMTHAASYTSSGSGGSPYEYGGQAQAHGSSSSGDYYTQSHGQPGRMISPGPNLPTSAARYPGPGCPSYAGGAPSASGWGPNGGGHAHGHGQQEMIHLAPLRHASGSAVGGGGGSTGSSASSPSSPALPSASVSGGYPVIQLSRAPFEQDHGRGVGVPGKKSVLSIGSIISDGV